MRKRLPIALALVIGFAVGWAVKPAPRPSPTPDWSAGIGVFRGHSPGKLDAESHWITPHAYAAHGRSVRLADPPPGKQVWTVTLDNQQVVIAGTLADGLQNGN
jgi:hypothetical protein